MDVATHNPRMDVHVAGRLVVVREWRQGRHQREHVGRVQLPMGRLLRRGWSILFCVYVSVDRVFGGRILSFVGAGVGVGCLCECASDLFGVQLLPVGRLLRRGLLILFCGWVFV